MLPEDDLAPKPQHLLNESTAHLLGCPAKLLESPVNLLCLAILEWHGYSFPSEVPAHNLTNRKRLRITFHAHVALSLSGKPTQIQNASIDVPGCFASLPLRDLKFLLRN